MKYLIYKGCVRKHFCNHWFWFNHDRLGSATIKIYGECAGTNSLYERRSALASHPSFAFFQEENILLTTLDGYIKENGVEKIDLLKIDVEGHELKVLQGGAIALASGRIRCIQFEYGGCFLDSGTTLKQVYTLLRYCGYELFRLWPYGKLRIHSYYPHFENYRYSNRLTMLA